MKITEEQMKLAVFNHQRNTSGRMPDTVIRFHLVLVLIRIGGFWFFKVIVLLYTDCNSFIYFLTS